MNGDLISRSALLEDGIKVRCGLNEDGLVFIPMADVYKSIKEAPAVDAVEVIRCKDCKFWRKDLPGCTDFVGCCNLAVYMVGATGYCVYGERKSENGNEADN